MVDAVYGGEVLPVGSRRRNGVGWWGVLCLIATEGSVFVYLLFGYYYFAAQHGAGWLPSTHPSLKLSGPCTIDLVLSSLVIWWAEGGAKKGDRVRHLVGTGVTILMGVLFLVLELWEWSGKTFSAESGSYGSLFFTITGFHMAHVFVGIIMLSVVFAWSAAGFFNPRRHQPVTIAATYWHFVDVVWIAVFSTLYLTPYLW
ncbi:MAG: cytochrome c oxidase subunit 3 [Caulobacteraceae bacterium]